MQPSWFSPVGRWATLLLSSVLGKLQEMIRVWLLWVVSAGPIPSHIAFIMDGNRRFADRLHVDRHIGHSHGYDALLRTLKDCFDLHVKIVTLFAFSIDNFQRPPDEVSALMDLMQTKLEALIEKQGLASEYGIRVQILGDLSLLPHGARIAAEKAMAVTRKNSSAVLNLCISYTATHEIVQSIQRTCGNVVNALGGDVLTFTCKANNSQQCLSGSSNSNSSRKLRCHSYQPRWKDSFADDVIRKADNTTKEGFSSNCTCAKHCCLNDRIVKLVKDFVSEEEIEKHLYTDLCPPPDLLIRTSGETRLSNFLLWQTSFSHLAFCKVLWPEFSFRHLFFIILEYQRALPSLLTKRQNYSLSLCRHQ